VKKKITVYRDKKIRTDEKEWEDAPPVLWEGSGDSPNRVVLPRKIGKHRPEEERGFKPTVL
jgi:hypothetical protein